MFNFRVLLNTRFYLQYNSCNLFILTYLFVQVTYFFRFFPHLGLQLAYVSSQFTLGRTHAAIIAIYKKLLCVAIGKKVNK